MKRKMIINVTEVKKNWQIIYNSNFLKERSVTIKMIEIREPVRIICFQVQKCSYKMVLFFYKNQKFLLKQL